MSARLHIPDAFPYATESRIRITDINYGGHLGNDACLAFFHEARVRYLETHACSETDIDGTALIMVDAHIAFTSEGFAGDRVRLEVGPFNPSRLGFDFYYRMTRLADERELARARTGMIGFDYERKRPVRLPRKILDLCGSWNPA